MNARRSLAVGLTALALPFGAAAQGFEGVLRQRMIMILPPGVAALAGADTSGTDRASVLAVVASKIDGADPSLVRSQDLTMYVKGSKLRVEGGSELGAGGYAIMDAATDSMFMVMPTIMQVLVTTGTEMGDLQKQSLARAGMDPAALSAKQTVTDIGESTIGGVRVHGYRTANEAVLGEQWFDPSHPDPEFPVLQEMLRKLTGITPDTAAAALLRGKGHSVRILTIMKAPPMLGEGWTVNRVDSSPLEKRPVEDTMFALPAQFPRVRLADMMPH